MKMKVEGKLIYRDTDALKIGVKIADDFDSKVFIPEFYIAMLRGMRDAHEDEFHEAMINFIEEELDND